MTTTTFNILDIRRRLGRVHWGVPQEFGDDGWIIDNLYHRSRIIVSDLPGSLISDGHDWIHASMSREEGVPDYYDMLLLHRAVWPDGYAYEVYAPPSAHINIHPNVLHLWGRADGSPALPDFGQFGTI